MFVKCANERVRVIILSRIVFQVKFVKVNAQMLEFFRYIPDFKSPYTTSVELIQ